jgi:hypothetical protein
VDVKWAKCDRGEWCSLDYLDLSRITVSGVYVIWKPGSTPAGPSMVVRVGRGDIASALAAERRDPQVTNYGPQLLVTWAEVAAFFSAGVEIYLAQQLRPLVGKTLPLAVGVAVNLPISA